MIIDVCGVSHRGNVRSHNEDNIYVDGAFRDDLSKENTIIRSNRKSVVHVFAVFDGLGGEDCGEQASLIAALGLKEMEDRGAAEDVPIYFSAVHQTILHEAARRNAGNMGTTAVVMHLRDGRASVCNIGDSRAYIFREGSLEQISKDHNTYQSLIEGGFSAQANINRERNKGELTQYIGMTSDDGIEPEAFTKEIRLQEGDIVLLCSDGLTAELSDEELCVIMDGHAGSAESLAVKLLKSALDRKCRDNVSAVVCMT